MWTAIGTAVLKGVVDRVLAPDKSNNSAGSSNYSQYSPDPPRSAYHQNQFYSSPQTSARHHEGPTPCHNCSKSSSKPRNNKTFSRSQKNESPFCTIKVQKNSDLEIKIKKTQSQMANMNIKVQSGAQKAGNNNLNSQKQNNSTFNKDNKNKEKVLNSNKTSNTGDNKFNTRNNVKPRNYLKSETTSTNTGNTWMYLGRLKIGTTEGDIHSYLSEKFPGRKFKVESLPLYKDGKLPCFKVLVDNSILTEFQDLGHWPQGVKVTKYRHNFKM